MLIGALAFLDRQLYSSQHAGLPFAGAPMNPRAAVAFLLSGGALWLLQGKHQMRSGFRNTGRLCAALVIGIALASLAEYFPGWNSRSEGLPADKGVEVVSPAMGAASVIGFLLLGTSLLSLDFETRRGRRPAHWLALGMAAFSLVFLIGCLHEATPLCLFVTGSRPMTMLSVIGFLLGSLAILASRPGGRIMQEISSERIGGVLLRRIAVAVVLVPLLIEALLYRGEVLGWYDVHTKGAMHSIVVTGILAALMWLAARSLNKIEEARHCAEEATHRLNVELEHRVAERTAQLEAANRDLQQLVSKWQQAQARLNEAQSVAKVGSWELDLRANVLTWSDETYRIFGVDPSKFGASYEAFLERVHPADRARVDQAYAESVASRTPYAIDHRMLMPDGGLKVVHERCRTFYDEHGQPVRSIGTVQDITERMQSEEALRMASGYHRSLIEASLDPLVTIGSDGKITDVNAATEAITGRARAELVDTDFSDYFTEPERARAGYQQVFKTGLVRDYALELKHRDGSVRSVLYNATVYRNEAGRVIGVFAAARDVTERKRAETELRRANRALRTMTACNQVQVSATEESGLLREVCRVIVEEGGYRLAWVGFAEHDEPKTVRPVAHAGYEQGYLEQTQITWADTERGQGPTGRAIRGGRPMVCRDARTDPTFAPWRDEAIKRGYASSLVLPLLAEGQVFGTLCIHAAEVDSFDAEEVGLLVELADGLALSIVSLRARLDRQRAEEALRLANAYNRSLIETSLDPLVTIGPDGKITDVNAATETATGHERAELVGKDFSDYFTKPEQARAGYQRAFQEGSVVDYPLELRHRDGKVISVLYNATVYRDAAGQVAGVFAAARDVTAREQAEAEIRRLNAELEQRVRDRTAQLLAANQELEAFAYSVSHDLRAPLRSVDGFSQILLEDYADKLDAEGVDSLNRVRAATQRMALLIDDLLRLSQITRTEMNRVPVDLSALASEIAAELRATDARPGTEWIIAPGLAATADAALIRVVLENLLGNAWKFTARKSAARIEFGAARLRDAAAFFVRDNGAGFDNAYVGKLFGAFQRLHKSTEFAGTGIGLATVQRIIRRHGGRVWAEGEVDRGATFYFTLPD